MVDHDREQRTEEATPRRRAEARERGQVPLSTELVAALGLAAGMAACLLGGPGLARTLAGQIEQTLAAVASLGTRELDVPGAARVLAGPARVVGTAALLVVVPTALACALAGYGQIGLRLAPKALEADPAKLDPLRGLQRILSLRGAARTGFSLAKVLLITAVAGTVAWLHVDEVVRAGLNELGPFLSTAGVLLLRTAAAALAVLVALALADLLVQRFQHERDLRMTRAEVKEEHRLMEGDPQVRARLRALRRELALRRMMDDVPRATVVVTNPTHYAVALRYEREEAARRAPVVVAKGVDHLAERIKGLALANGVVCHEDVALARALHARVRIGQEIPAELYGAVAAVLAHVYRLQESGAR